MKIPTGPIASMSFGTMLYPIDDSRMKSFSDSLDEIYTLAENHLGFVWRMPEDEISDQLTSFGFNSLTSASLSVWHSYDTFKNFTFDSQHNDFLKRRLDWFAPISSQQLVIWSVSIEYRPTLEESLDRLNYLKKHGNSDFAFGWLQE